ncbi:MAG: hypothetical protein A3H96_19000 [Acidobacteria bacterium RIFCSPLOWO2_02_FULL_67_36]|nr:MAG: hypothetical protein A3H96_19000 [Acidobacteria bacterium RIFCSPLOWO2_02_FULL_67_36]OFW20257.1 MAG: hypothetical protein A3G21_26695 [Acidobacteria bacterium RIFCSPLOWO2_12_FULL_66_21]
MTTEPNEPNEHVDRTLRDAFAVGDDVARRVSDHALAAPPHRPRRAPLVASLALAAVTLCAGLVAWLSRPPVRPSHVTTAPANVTELTGSFVDGVLIVPIPGDVIVIAGPGQPDDRPPEGSGVVLLEGDAR